MIKSEFHKQHIDGFPVCFPFVIWGQHHLHFKVHTWEEYKCKLGRPIHFWFFWENTPCLKLSYVCGCNFLGGWLLSKNHINPFHERFHDRDASFLNQKFSTRANPSIWPTGGSIPSCFHTSWDKQNLPACPQASPGSPWTASARWEKTTGLTSGAVLPLTEWDTQKWCLKQDISSWHKSGPMALTDILMWQGKGLLSVLMEEQDSSEWLSFILGTTCGGYFLFFFLKGNMME